MEYSINDDEMFESRLDLRAWHVGKYKSKPWHVASIKLKRRSKNVASMTLLWKKIEKKIVELRVCDVGHLKR